MPAVDSKRLTKAKQSRQDEYYTRFEDIAAELPRYKEQLRGKRIICPCDWDESADEAFVYASEEYVTGSDLFSPGGSVKVIDADKTDNKVMADINTVKCNFAKFLISHAEAYGIASVSVSGYNPATGAGVRFQDIDYSKYDLVITNPPFSQFREFIDTMFANDLQFLVIGPKNGIKYKETFPRIRDNQMWLGYTHEIDEFDSIDGEPVRSPCVWFTNLDVSYRHDRKILTEEYDPASYPSYTNFDGIDVDKVSRIPYDWPGYMGVPITILQTYNPEQFEIIGLGEGDLAKEVGITRNHTGRTKLSYPIPGGFKEAYARLIIRNLHPEEPQHEK